jgi:hypothetical protein
MEAFFCALASFNCLVEAAAKPSPAVWTGVAGTSSLPIEFRLNRQGASVRRIVPGGHPE